MRLLVITLILFLSVQTTFASTQKDITEVMERM